MVVCTTNTIIISCSLCSFFFVPLVSLYQIILLIYQLYYFYICTYSKCNNIHFTYYLYQQQELFLFIFILGTRFGAGVYFARDAKFASRYAPRDRRGLYTLYYAKVLTGEYTRGHTSMLAPPSKRNPNNPALHYDSTVNSVKKPKIFVVYYDSQVYPEYVLTIKEG